MSQPMRYSSLEGRWLPVLPGPHRNTAPKLTKEQWEAAKKRERERKERNERNLD